jgi:hypothetical protein
MEVILERWFLSGNILLGKFYLAITALHALRNDNKRLT